MEVELRRRAYLPTVTLGELVLGSLTLFTLERPWIPNPDGKGGLPRLSCVPDGAYTILPHNSERFPRSYALVSDEHGVYYQEKPQGQSWGRTAILLHPGNKVIDVIGCIAPGMRQGIMEGHHWLFESHNAMDHIRSLLGRKDNHTLTIRPETGTQETVK